MEAVKPATLQIGVAVQKLSGQPEPGDTHLVQPFDHGCLVAVVDGLGHGADAGQAARQATGLMAKRPGDSILALVRDCHETLRSTRGAVLSLASFNTVQQTMTWTGIGNVEGVLLRRDVTARPE